LSLDMIGGCGGHGGPVHSVDRSSRSPVSLPSHGLREVRCEGATHCDLLSPTFDVDNLIGTWRWCRSAAPGARVVTSAEEAHVGVRLLGRLAARTRCSRAGRWHTWRPNGRERAVPLTSAAEGAPINGDD
jgi:hypothetical protein